MVCLCVIVYVGVRPVGVDRQTAGAHERSSSLGRHPAGLPAGVGGHRVRLQPGNSHRLPAHPFSAGTAHTALTRLQLAGRGEEKHWHKIRNCLDEASVER